VVVRVWLPCVFPTGKVCHPSILEAKLLDVGAFKGLWIMGGPWPLGSDPPPSLVQGPLPSEGVHGLFL